MAFEPEAYKTAVTQEWGRAAQGWHDCIPKINDWLNDAKAEIQKALKNGPVIIH